MTGTEGPGGPAQLQPTGRRSAQWPAYAFGLAFATLVAYLVYQSGADKGQTGGDVTTQVRSYQVLSDQQLQVDVIVERDPARALLCLVGADDATGTQVGSTSLPVPANPAGPRKVELRAVVPTTARPATGTLVDCSPVPPDAPAPQP